MRKTVAKTDRRRMFFHDVVTEMNSAPIRSHGSNWRSASHADKAHDRIEREAERLNELIGQLLRLTELESSEQAIKREPIHLAELIAVIAAFGI